MSGIRLGKWRAACAIFWIAYCGAAWGAFPALSVEATPEHPLFLFRMGDDAGADAAGYGQKVAQAWAALPEALRPYAALIVDAAAPSARERVERYRALLPALQQAGAAVALQVAEGSTLQRIVPTEAIEPLLSEFSCVKGVVASGLNFNDYPPDGGALGPSPIARWLMATAGSAAQYGRFLAWEMDPLDWPRMMSQPGQRPLYDRLRECSGYVFPIVRFRGQQCLAGLTSACGLWLEGATEAWGVAPTTQWFTDAGFVQPGLFGPAPDPLSMSPGLYRTMVLEGAMFGATVYLFDAPNDLWFGLYRKYWDEAIKPVLGQLANLGLIPRKEFVAKKAKVGYQLAPAQTPAEFHVNLRDIDGVYDEGRLIRGAYGMERPGQVPELIPNTGRHYGAPIVSAFASQEALSGFSFVGRPGTAATADAWVSALDQYLTPDGSGSATIVRVGRSLFVFNNRENAQEAQDYRVPDMPAAVRGLEARRTAGGVQLTWPQRPADLEYRAYRRLTSEKGYALLAKGIEQATWLDATADPNASYAYAVTAVTDSKEVLEGTLGFGESLALVMGESRIEEEAAVSPALAYGQGAPISPAKALSYAAEPWWPTFEGTPPEQMETAKSVAQRLEQLDAAFSSENLDGVMDLYAGDYEDAEGWRRQYVLRAYQWFFERYGACKMVRQIRRWDFGGYAQDGSVKVTVYCRFWGTAISDASGRVGDVAACFPRTESGEVTFTFMGQEGTWRIASTSPALPNFRDILSFSAGPFDRFAVGPDTQH